MELKIKKTKKNQRQKIKKTQNEFYKVASQTNVVNCH